MRRRSLLAGAIAGMTLSLGGCVNPLGVNGGSGSIDVTAPPDAPDIEPEAVHALAGGNASFGLELIRELSGDEPSNLMLSPVSLGTAVGMAYAGANGDTAEELRETLRYLETEDATHSAIATLLVELNETSEPSSGAFELAVANAFWGSDAIDFHESYLEILAEFYGSEINDVDFGDSAGATEQINTWTAEHTNDRIDELLPDGALSGDTTAVLTNAVYLLADWEKQFDPDDTTTATFENLDGTTSEVELMSQTDDFVHHRTVDQADDALEGCMVAALPYVSSDVQMVVFLPPRDGFEAFTAALTGEWLIEQFDRLDGTRATEARLSLPRFELEDELQLRSTLEALGLTAPFDPAVADFSGMAPGGEGFWIDEIYHDTFIAVDEAGTEAAAASGVVMDESAPPQIHCDRPFLYAIRHRPTDAVLFLGQFVDASPLT